MVKVLQAVAMTRRWAALEDEADDAAEAGSRAGKRRKTHDHGSPQDPPKLRGILASGGGSGGTRKVRWADGDGTEAAGFSIGGVSGQQVRIAVISHMRHGILGF